ncbi:hypothetical protein GGX14DRAFT_428943, partial [Mycena pura]
MLPPELVELIIYHAWGCLSTTSHRHAYSMVQWMLVSHGWLQIVLSVVFRDLWITSYAHMNYIHKVCFWRFPSFISEIAGILDVRRYLAESCRSLTLSVYQSLEEYTSQCTELVEYATTDSDRPQLLRGSRCYLAQQDAIQCLPDLIWDITPYITALHCVLVDCAATCREWNTFVQAQRSGEFYPLSLTELHVTFAYTSPPPAVLLDASRGTFFPPPSDWDLPWICRFDGVRRLVVRDANADFVAFLTTVCPRLERVDGGIPCGGCARDCACGRQGPARVRAPPAYRRMGPDGRQRYGAVAAHSSWPAYPESPHLGSPRSGEEDLHVAPVEECLHATTAQV